MPQSAAGTEAKPGWRLGRKVESGPQGMDKQNNSALKETGRGRGVYTQQRVLSAAVESSELETNFVENSRRSPREAGLRVVVTVDASSANQVRVSHRLAPLLCRLGSDRLLVELASPLELGIVQAAGVAKRAGAVRAAPPLGRIDPVTAVTPTRGRRALSLV